MQEQSDGNQLERRPNAAAGDIIKTKQLIEHASVLERLSVLHAVLNDEIHVERRVVGRNLITPPGSRQMYILVVIYVYSKLSSLVLGEVCRSRRRVAYSHSHL